LKTSLSLHQLCALDAEPAELARAAARLGCAFVSLFTFVPAGLEHIYPRVEPDDAAQLRTIIDRCGVEVLNLEFFPLDQDGSLARFDRALAAGAALGARHATAHIHDADLATAVARFAEFAQHARRFNIGAVLEFNSFSAIRSAHEGAQVVRAAGAGALVLDTLHLVRAGKGAGDLADTADLVALCQLSDGPVETAAAWHEAIAERMLPGTGTFPLGEIIRMLPRSTIFEVEVPQRSAMVARVPAEERARRAVLAARWVLQTYGRGTQA
jgi:sugar phosphate isomerase/epimerase